MCRNLLAAVAGFVLSTSVLAQDNAIPATLQANRCPIAYPLAARDARIGGTAVVSVDIDADGLATGVRLAASSGNDGLDAAAVEGARRCVYAPAMEGSGRLVDGKTSFRIWWSPLRDPRGNAWQGVVVDGAKFPATNDLSVVRFEGQTVADKSLRTRVLLRIRGDGESQARCENIDSVAVTPVPADAPIVIAPIQHTGPDDELTQELWSIQQCGVTRRYVVTRILWGKQGFVDFQVVPYESTTAEPPAARPRIVAVAPAQVHAEYDRLKARMGSQAYHMRHIVVATRAQAETALARLHDGQSFAEVATDMSTDRTSSSNGGDAGWFGAKDVPGALARQMTALAPHGLATEPVETWYGWHVIEVLETRDRDFLPFDKVKAMVETSLVTRANGGR